VEGYDFGPRQNSILQAAGSPKADHPVEAEDSLLKNANKQKMNKPRQCAAGSAIGVGVGAVIGVSRPTATRGGMEFNP
jgi:hypothetical protein